jgi:hypothetical protein
VYSSAFGNRKAEKYAAVFAAGFLQAAEIRLWDFFAQISSY